MRTSTTTFSKKERVVSRKLMDALFQSGNSKSVVAFPLRVVYLYTERAEGEEPAQVLVSVSKRHFKHAVDRNRVKRQIREAYRLTKHVVMETMDAHSEKRLVMAFIWLTNEKYPSARVKEAVEKTLSRIAEKNPF